MNAAAATPIQLFMMSPPLGEMPQAADADAWFAWTSPSQDRSKDEPAEPE
jgi:hypothetical protein